MFVFNRWNQVTGTIVYENTHQVVSGLLNYPTATTIQTGCRFTLVKKNNFIRKTEESDRFTFDQLVTQFGWDQLRSLSSTGVEIKVGRTRLQYDGEEYRAINVNNFGQKYNKTYLPMGVVQVTFEKRVAIAD